MSKRLIDQTIQDLDLSGNLKIFYDFNDYSGSYVNSVGLADPAYSGEIINYNSNFTGQTSGSGFFNDQCISIQNSTGITSEAATIIFSQKKTGVSNGVIFSHLDSNGPSGWEIGINSANKLYYKNYVNGSPNYETLESYLSDQNICAITLSEFGAGDIYRLNYEKKVKRDFVYNFIQTDDPKSSIQYYGLDSKSFNLPAHSVSNGANWNIGSGEFLYQGYIDNVLYFDRRLNNDQIRKLSYAIYSDFEITPATSGIKSGLVTGYQVTASGVSGEVGKPFIVTGTGYNSGYYTYTSGVPLTGTVGVSGYVYVPKTGIDEISGTNQIAENIYKKVHNLSNIFNIDGSVKPTGLSNYYSSGAYWFFSGNSGTFNSQSAVGPSGTIFGITGFETVTLTGYTSGYGNTLVTTGSNTGLLYDVFTKSGIRAPDEYYRTAEERITYSNNLNSEYYANAITLIGENNESYLYDLVYDAFEYEDLNETPEARRHIKYKKIVPKITGSIDSHYLNFAINGISQFTGTVTFGKNQFNFPTYNVDTGFNSIRNEIFTNTNLDRNDLLIYDTIHSGNKNSFHVTELNQYLSRPFTSFDFEDSDVFLNGVKLYSGIDYIDSGGFYPINNSTGTLGLYFTYPKYSGAYSLTGYGNTGINIDHDAINPDSYTIFYNGVRQPKGKIIPHARYSDLIGGVIMKESNSLLYFMSDGNKQKL